MDRYKPLVHEVTATVRMGCDPSGEYVKALDYDALAEDAKNLASERDSLEGRIRELEAKLCLTEGAFKNTRIRELEARESEAWALLTDVRFCGRKGLHDDIDQWLAAYSQDREGEQ